MKDNILDTSVNIQSDQQSKLFAFISYTYTHIE